MRAAVTGASGFIGSHLIDSLLERGWRVKVFRHLRPFHRPDVDVFSGQIDRVDDLQPFCQDVDLVFHLASAMGSAQLPPEEFYRVNVEGTRAILQAAKKAGVKRFIHLSSAGVLGAVPENLIADENLLPRPITLYDQTKAKGEALALEASKEGLAVVVVRPGWVYGPRDRRTFKLFKAIKKRQFIIVGDGRGRQTPIWIGDLIDGLLLAAEKGRKGEIYHLAGKEILTVKEMVEMIAEALGVKLLPLHLPVWPTKWLALCFDKVGLWLHQEMPLNTSRLSFFLHSKPLAITKARKELGFNPQCPFKEGLSLTIKWYIDHGWL
ncbi:MAG: NAD-dependent epimerase/dehydratase family protein [Candidatus Aminicenantes bacterium]|nr:NAD-dependent epimerase/dehydratase family protein [Candidatus Aminicenantes bacterium]